MLYIKAKDQYILCDTFMRLQEYYESPLKSIKGKCFTKEEFIDEYITKYKKFDYYNIWIGFNVPGNITKKFFKVFDDFSKKEKFLVKSVEINFL